MTRRHKTGFAALLAASAALLLGGCGEVSDRSASVAATSQASLGQVTTAPAPGSVVSAYAAARFLEQASFGPTPESVARVREIGMAAWIDEQLALPASRIDTLPVRVDVAGSSVWLYPQRAVGDLALAAPDQLRARVGWALSQFIVVSIAKVSAYGVLEFYDTLLREAFSNYGELTREVSVHAAMGFYLDNRENRPAGACPNCAPNENFARELMQLFTLGVYRLGRDGSVLRDAEGRALQTYSQEDVEELARALTGWDYAPSSEPLPGQDWGNFSVPMQPAPWPAAHDRGSKQVLGTTIPSGLDASQELDIVVSLLMQHPNIAPFIALRLIQHLVTSDPSPAYVERVATAFEDDGQGTRGNMAAVVRAVLLDPEARQADLPGAVDPRVGKIREPVLWWGGLLRGIGCQRWPLRSWTNPSGQQYDWLIGLHNQQPLNARSVFSFYLPSDRAPGSQLLAPEQRLLDATEFQQRVGDLGGLIQDGMQHRLAEAGCDFDALVSALDQSPARLAELLSQRYFRGSLPPTLRTVAVELDAELTWASREQRAATMLQFLLSSPAYGVQR